MIRVFAVTFVLLLAAYGNALADSPPSQAFIALAQPYQHITGSATPMQGAAHFFPLPARRPMGKLIVSRAKPITPSDDDMSPPTPSKGQQQAITQEQASQIISLFGAAE